LFPAQYALPYQERLRKAFATIQTLYGEVLLALAMEKSSFFNRNVRVVNHWWDAMGTTKSWFHCYNIGAQEKTCCFATLGRSGRAPRQKKGWRIALAGHPTSNSIALG
jgi:hypothetical protein